MAIILTNDDGIDAPGLRALCQALEQEKVIVAPQRQHSGCGHQTTTDTPLQIKQRSPQEYAITGTPADCVRLAIAQLNLKIDWVISGVNAGGNLGIDIYMSGTVAAVREATFHGIPGIAISHWIKPPQTIDWEQTTQWTAHILSRLLTLPLQPGCFWNVNLPHLPSGSPPPEIVFCPLSTEPLPISYRVEGENYFYTGVYEERKRKPGTDVDICFAGKIAISQLHL